MHYRVFSPVLINSVSAVELLGQSIQQTLDMLIGWAGPAYNKC